MSKAQETESLLGQQISKLIDSVYRLRPSMTKDEFQKALSDVNVKIESIEDTVEKWQKPAA